MHMERGRGKEREREREREGGMEGKRYLECKKGISWSSLTRKGGIEREPVSCQPDKTVKAYIRQSRHI